MTLPDSGFIIWEGVVKRYMDETAYTTPPISFQEWLNSQRFDKPPSSSYPDRSGYRQLTFDFMKRGYEDGGQEQGEGSKDGKRGTSGKEKESRHERRINSGSQG